MHHFSVPDGPDSKDNALPQHPPDNKPPVLQKCRGYHNLTAAARLQQSRNEWSFSAEGGSITPYCTRSARVADLDVSAGGLSLQPPRCMTPVDACDWCRGACCKLRTYSKSRVVHSSSILWHPCDFMLVISWHPWM